LINDADAAALAESQFGKWPQGDRTVLFLTIGTGIGSSLWIDRKCLMNSELGQMRMKKKVSFEDYASDRTRKVVELSWKKWGERLNKVLKAYDLYFSKPHFIIGGGIAQKKERYARYIDEDIDWDTAKLENEAGIIGAAMTVAGD
jgi:polyphosphate glucokinase